MSRADDVLMVFEEIRSASPSWYRQSELAEECLSDFRKRHPRSEPQIAVGLQMLTRLWLLKRSHPGRGSIQTRINRQLKKVARPLARTYKEAERLADGPVGLLDPRAVPSLQVDLRGCVKSLERIFAFAQAGWEDWLRAMITVEFETGRQAHNDNVTGELIAIAVAMATPAASAALRKLTPTQEKLWRDRARERQKQWRHRHAQLLQETRDTRP